MADKKKTKHEFIREAIKEAVRRVKIKGLETSSAKGAWRLLRVHQVVNL